MESFFNGTEIRDEILLGLRRKIVDSGRTIQLAILLIGDDPVCRKYVELKKKYADKLDICFSLYQFDSSNTEAEIESTIEFLNKDTEVNGIMIQIPIEKKFNRDNLIRKIAPEKDIDGLRFCLNLKSDFRPPVVLAILEALKRSKVLLQDKKILIVGRGFLVGDPTARALKESGYEVMVADSSTKDLSILTRSASVIISAVGQAGMIKNDMINPDTVLIDAGTAEQNGTLVGDIDPLAFKEAAYYTPVPGGIGPVTIAKLFENLTTNGRLTS